MAEHDCRDLVERMTAFLDGELEGPSCDEIRQHLDACDPCHRNADLERTFKSFIAVSCRESAPTDLVSRVRGLLDQFET